MKKVLIVGDWLVDEHWVVGLHRSESASRAGRRHSRALHESNCSVRSLCGAGQVGTILYNARRQNEHLFSIAGIGLWRKRDERELVFMLDPANNIGNTPHRLLQLDRGSPDEMDRAKLYNLAGESLGSEIGTTTVIRVYEQQGQKVYLRDRLDWELRVNHHMHERLQKQASTSLNGIPDLDSIEMVVVKDLGKGVVTPNLIEVLGRKIKHASWYVSTKSFCPDWYNNLPKERVRLILIPQLAATRAIRTGKVSSSSWITIGKTGSKGAFEALDELVNKFPEANMVVLPEGMTILARDKGTNHNVQGYRQTEKGDLERCSVVPMASVFFASLVSYLHEQEPRTKLGECLDKALSFTDEWMRLEYRRLLEVGWKPSQEQHLDLNKNYTYRFEKQNPVGWYNALRHWDESARDLGIVHYQTRDVRKLQLWRAMTEVGGYIACVPSIRKALMSLMEQCNHFKRERARHMAVMLLDVPGSGKSYLASCLARQMKMRFLPFNITQMLSRKDLMKAFDKIVTSQAQNPQESLLVFVDEINATLDGQHVYDAFLAPLEEGVYARDGNSFHIAPCFWLFAGTRNPQSEESGGSGTLSNKGSDFVSRLTLPPFTLSINERDPREVDARRLEKIYIGAMSIQNNFPDVSRATKRVIDAIDMLPPDISPRELNQFIKRFQDVQYGMVNASNLPPDMQDGSRRASAKEKYMIHFENSPDDDLHREVGRSLSPVETAVRKNTSRKKSVASSSSSRKVVKGKGRKVSSGQRLRKR